MESPSPLWDGVAFRANRSRVTGFAAGSLILAAALIHAGWSRPTPLTGLDEMTAVLVAYVGAALLTSGALIIGSRHFRWGKPIVTIDERGILDRRVSPYVLPWSHIRDVRFLDRRGHRLCIEMDNRVLLAPQRRSARLEPVLADNPAERLTVIDTFFLQSATGSPLLDFLLPITAIAPFDVSDNPVSDRVRQADAREDRRRRSRTLIFGAVSALVPAIAAAYLVAG